MQMQNLLIRIAYSNKITDRHFILYVVIAVRFSFIMVLFLSEKNSLNLKSISGNHNISQVIIAYLR